MSRHSVKRFAGKDVLRLAVGDGELSGLDVDEFIHDD